MIIGSGNGTWLDRAESSGVRFSGRRGGGEPAIFAAGQCWAECFSAGPLAGVAAALLSDRLPVTVGSQSEIRPVDREFAAIASDFNGLAAGVRLKRGRST
jgi:hypothetical protein